MFDVTSNKGFQITFANGWTASVQWGNGNYCSNRNVLKPYFGGPVPPSTTAEISCWPKDGDRTNIWGEDHHDTVYGWATPEEVVNFLNKVASF